MGITAKMVIAIAMAVAMAIDIDIVIFFKVFINSLSPKTLLENLYKNIF
jgi:hypothetical protein